MRHVTGIRRGIALTLALLCISCAYAHEIEVNLRGQKQTITSTPHRPYLVISSLADLREHYGEIRNVLPPLPFQMEREWVLPDGDGFRALAHWHGFHEQFSENCRYMVREDVRAMEPAPWSRRISVHEVGKGMLWQADRGPGRPEITNDGRVIGTIGLWDTPLHLEIRGLDGSLLATVDDPQAPSVGTWQLQLVEAERLAIVRSIHRLLAVDYDGSVLWRKELSPTPGNLPYPVFSEALLDPLGRGLLVVTGLGRKFGRHEIIDLATGEPRELLAEGDLQLPSVFSRNGRYAVTYRSPVLAVTDWASGATLFEKELLAVPHTVPPRGGDIVLSDAPTCLVTRQEDEGATTTVTNQNGEITWRCTTSLGEVRHIISDNAGDLCIYPRPGSGANIDFMLFYKLPAAPN